MLAPKTSHSATVAQSPQGSPGQAVSPPLVAPQPVSHQQWSPPTPAAATAQPAPPRQTQAIPTPNIMLPASLNPLLSLQVPNQQVLASAQPTATPRPDTQTPQYLQAQLAQVPQGYLMPFQPFGVSPLPSMPAASTPPILGGGHHAILQQLKASSELQRVVQLQIHYLVSSLLSSGLTIDQISFLIGQNNSPQPAGALHQNGILNMMGQAHGQTQPQSQSPILGKPSDQAASHAPPQQSGCTMQVPIPQASPSQAPVASAPIPPQGQSPQTAAASPKVPPPASPSQAASQPLTQTSSQLLASPRTAVSREAPALRPGQSTSNDNPEQLKVRDTFEQPRARDNFQHVVHDSLRSNTSPPVYVSSDGSSEVFSAKGDDLPPMRAVGVVGRPRGSKNKRVGRPRTKNRVDNLDSKEDPLRHTRDMSIIVSSPVDTNENQSQNLPSCEGPSEVRPQRRNFFARFVEVNPAVKAETDLRRTGRPRKSTVEPLQQESPPSSPQLSPQEEKPKRGRPARDKAKSKPGPKPGRKRGPKAGAQGAPRPAVEDAKARREQRAQERRSRENRIRAANKADYEDDALEEEFEADLTADLTGKPGVPISLLPPPVQPQIMKPEQNSTNGTGVNDQPVPVKRRPGRPRKVQPVMASKPPPAALASVANPQVSKSFAIPVSPPEVGTLSSFRTHSFTAPGAARTPPSSAPTRADDMPPHHTSTLVSIPSSAATKSFPSSDATASNLTGISSASSTGASYSTAPYASAPTRSAPVSGAPPPVMPLNARITNESEEDYDSNEAEDSEENGYDSDSSYSDKRQQRLIAKRAKAAAKKGRSESRSSSESEVAAINGLPEAR